MFYCSVYHVGHTLQAVFFFFNDITIFLEALMSEAAVHLHIADITFVNTTSNVSLAYVTSHSRSTDIKSLAVISALKTHVT